MSAEAKTVWEALAPLATREGTLVPGTVVDFAMTCELFVQQFRSHKAMERLEAGGEDWLKVSRVYLAMTRDLKEKLRAFRLAPNGLPMVTPESQEKPKSALERLKERGRALHAIG